MGKKKGDWCPLIKKDCVEHKCAWYTQVSGVNPQTGQPVDDWGCAVSWLPMMSIEMAQKSNQTGAAVETFRNEVVKANQSNQQLYVDALNSGIIPAQIKPLDQPLPSLEGKNDA